MFNPLTCQGFSDITTGSWVASGSCLKARLGFIILFFVISFVRRWGGEEVGLNFSFLFGLIGGMLPYLIIIFIFGSFKAAMIIGLIGMLIGGYGGGIFFEGGESY